MLPECENAGTLIPVPLGAGKRLFDHLGTEPIERTRVVEATEGVTHLRFRVVK